MVRGIPLSGGEMKKSDKLKGQVWKLFSRYIRLRDCLKTTGTPDSGKCVSCGKEFNIKETDAGHFIAGRGNSILFDEKCCHLQCKKCNLFLNGNQLPYRRAIVQMYGEGYDEYLERKSKIPKSFETWELEAMKEMYRDKIKDLETRGVDAL